MYPRYAYVAPPGYLPNGQPGPDQPELGEDGPKSDFAFDLALGTAFPLGLGPQLGLELPARILLSVELGWMPAAYGSAVVGIIEACGVVERVQPTGRGLRLRIHAPFPIAPGASLAVNGVCLTAIGAATYDVVPETLSKTNLGSLKTGSRVNLERAEIQIGRAHV